MSLPTHLQAPPGAGDSSMFAATSHSQNLMPPLLASSSDSGRQAVQQAASPLRVEAATGAASLSVPVYVSPGRDAGTTPGLELTYSSHAANGPFGLGWSLTLPCISRKTSKAVPRYDDEDVFVMAGAEDLVCLEGSPSTNSAGYLVRQYKPRVQFGASQARIERWTNRSDPTDEFWRTVSAAGLITEYGKTAEERICDCENTERIFTWYISASYDLKGNCCAYQYKAEDSTNVDLSCVHEQNRSALGRTAGRYLKRVLYGNRQPNRDLDTWTVQPVPVDATDYLFTLVFDYGDHDQALPQPSEQISWPARADPFSSSVAGFEVRTYRLCRRMLLFHNFSQDGVEDSLVASTVLTYEEAATGSALVAITRHGHRRVPEGAGYQYTDETRPALQMEYSQPELQPGASGEALQPVAVDTSQFPDLPHAHPNRRTQWLDLNGEGSPGLLAQLSTGEWVYMRNESSRDGNSTASFHPPQRLLTVPSSLLNPAGFFASLADDGSLQAVDVDGHHRLQGYSERNPSDDAGWSPWVLLPSVPTDLDDSGLHTYSIDLAGSGRQDRAQFMQDSSGRLQWYPSLGTSGFAAGRIQTGPLLPRDEGGTAAVLLADMTGDGLTDVVHVRTGDIVYWPNLGHGRFGAMVRMDHAPILSSYPEFNASQVRLMDVNGSGGADLVHFIPGGGAAIYFNQSGNSWSKAISLPVVPDLSLLASIEVVDILGRGLPCLCWTLAHAPGEGSPRLYYLDLLGGTKPWLLTRYTNGVGAEVTLKYLPSTHFYLQDEGTSQAWNTKLPFPVVCVAAHTIEDQVAETKQTTRYAYHDGFYDRAEREFRGFGLVDVWDQEDLAAGPGLKRLHVPTRHSRTWFHTGAPMLALGTAFGHGNARVPELAPFHLPQDAVSPDEVRESRRAMKGKILRCEVYANEQSKNDQIPLLVTQHSYTVLMEQAINDIASHTRPDTVVYEQPHGRFRVVDRESLKITYAGASDLQDARMEHDMDLAINEYGQSTTHVLIQYGRLNPPPDLDDQTRAAQQETIIQYTESALTNPLDEDDVFALPMVAEEKAYRLRGVSPPDPPLLLFAFESLAADDCALLRHATEVPYEQDPGPAVSPGSYRVLISNTRSYYRASDMTGRLALGKIEAYSTLDQTYQLAVTPGLKLQVFGDSQDPTSLHAGWSAQDGAYADLDNDGSWWIPSQRSRFCSPDDAMNTGAELREARSHFYLPTFAIDPYGNVSSEELDRYCLLRIRSVDSVGNAESYQPDYVSLQPIILTDSNQNRTLLVFDSFGTPIGAAIQGKVGEGLGDTLDDFTSHLSREDILSFMNDPVASAPTLLGSATWRRVYNREWGPETPIFQGELRRDRHASSSTQISISISFSDGRGHNIQSAVLHSGHGAARWRREGWSIHSTIANKPVLVFLPTLDSVPRYCRRSVVPPESLPPSSITIFEGLNRAAATLHPGNTWQVTTFGPWTVKQRDAGDNVLIEDMALDPDIGRLVSATMGRERYQPTWYATHSAATASAEDQAAAEKSKVYSDTPDLHHVDAAGRTISWVTSEGSPVRQTSRLHLDVAGNATAAFDTLAREVTRSQRDLCGRDLYAAGMDNGPAWSCPDAVGRRWLAWTVDPDNGEPATRTRMQYDQLGRLTHVWLREGIALGTPECLIIQHDYGETQPDAAAKNLRTQHYCTWDQAGLLANTAYDFKGNCVRRETTFAEDYKGTLDWSAAGRDRPALETVNVEQAEYDACNKLLRIIGVGGSITENTYNVAGSLQSVCLARGSSPDIKETFLSSIAYNAMGQRELVKYGNGVQTQHKYDPLTNREVHKKTWKTGGAVLRDLQYTHDCMGRQVYREDAAQQDVFFRNSVVRPVNDYIYDARGQLVRSTGREQIDGQGSSLTPSGPAYDGQQTVPSNGSQMCEYTETVAYDAAGNISSLTHESGDSRVSGWKRSYFYAETSNLTDPTSGIKNNRLSRTTVRGAEENYYYDARGCMTSMPGTMKASWDHFEQLRVSTSQRIRQGVPETTYYVYNALGVRVRKVTERAAAEKKDASKLRETYTLSGFGGYEIYREYSGASGGSQGALKSQKKTVQVHDGGSTPLALVEEATTGLGGLPSASSRFLMLLLIRYQLDDGLEVDDLGQVISMEEYSPFGPTTFRATRSDVDSPAKYRFAGYPRDTQETGLYHCEARYYAAWIGRWTSSDPLGVLDGLNVYCYVGNDPVNRWDPKGTIEEPQGLGTSRQLAHILGETQFRPTTSLGIARHIYGEGRGRLHLWGSVVEFEEPLSDRQLRQVAHMAYFEMSTDYDTNLYRRGRGANAVWRTKPAICAFAWQNMEQVDKARTKATDDRPRTFKPTVMTAFAVKDTNMVIFASSMKSQEDGGDPKRWTYSQRYLHSLLHYHPVEREDQHQFGACGEIMAINQWYRQNPPTNTGIPAGHMMAYEAGRYGGGRVKPPCGPAQPGENESWGCKYMLQRLGIPTIDAPPNADQLPKSRILRWWR
ncbi:hypothetical protein Aspvir_002785 [Aspergillus viridinutans]|uniref:SpvB-domain-containing protein n=1 Tax=Aspergillus viridinutans TaxID=75553 RepID=A0A9P3C1M5_ASPVI|nr:uncharacterized protein Aspvir_002785 [Aspergillus viridinutans]GIK07130.1 hypothetical protein Aspvir_002785 [Aspergillus viridinutans]